MSTDIYAIELDFEKDLLERIIAELKGYDIIVDPTEPLENIQIKYYNFKRRLIQNLPRQVFKSTTFSCPTELEAGLNDIEKKISTGENLYPNLSRRLFDLDYNDDLLNDWGIYHLHLGTILEGDGFVKRTGPLLFARFDNENAYLINVMVHGSWTKQEMIRVLHDNWPESIEKHKQTGFDLIHVPTDEEIKLARANGIIMSTQIEPGIYYDPIGGGQTSAKNSIEVMRIKAHVNKIIKRLEEQIRKNANRYGQMLKEQNGYLGKQLNFQLAFKDGKYFAFEKNTGVFIGIE